MQEPFEGGETSEQRKKRLARERMNNSRKKQKIRNTERRVEGIRHELGRMDQICTHCGAKFWLNEKDRNSSRLFPKFAVCCAGDKVHLPRLLEPPSYLLNLYTSPGPDANSFRKNIRAYNNILACTSFRANIDENFQAPGISNFRIHGQVYHRIRSLLPDEGKSPKFAQLYIHDTAHENKNRCNIIQNLNEDILQNLQNMLYEHNSYIQSFRQVRDLIQTNISTEISMLIHSDRTRDPRRYNAPTASDIATIIIGDSFDIDPSNRDILLKLHDRGLQRISELHPLYDPLQYVLLFPKGDDSWHLNIPLTDAVKRERVTTMQFYSYRLQIRDGDWIQYAGRLYQQYIVDQYAKIEQN